MKKTKSEVGIITKMSKNYGAVLQAFALKKTIEMLGHSACIINYNGAVGNDTYQIFKRGRGIRTLIYNIKRFTKQKGLRKSIEKFQNFRSEYFNLTEPYNNYCDFVSKPPDCITYIVGSDQVWNPKILFSPIYYLKFGDPTITRISYAASFGETDIHPDYKNVIQNYLRSFNGISVREDNGETIVRGLGLRSEVVLDPTLLLDDKEWSEIGKEPSNIPEHYILCYCLHYPPQIDEVLSKIKANYNFQVVNIATDVNMKDIGDIQRWDIGPQEFVWLLQHADVVVTSSFHGTVFSIIFDKPFYTISLNRKDGRLNNLLNKLEIPRHLIDDVDKYDFGQEFTTPYIKSKDIIRRLKESSLAFLKSYL